MAEKAAGKKVSYESQESLYKKALAKLQANDVIVQYKYKMDNAQLAASMFESVGDYLDAPVLRERCLQLYEQAREDEKEYIYQTACRQEKEAREASEWDKLREIFLSLGEYKDAGAHTRTCQSRGEALKRKGRRKRATVLGTLLILAIALTAGFASGFMNYVMGWGYMKAGMYTNAIQVFQKMPGFLSADRYEAACQRMRIVEGSAGTEVVYGQSHWTILKKEGSVYTMIASNVGEGHPFYHVAFHDKPEEVTWKDSALRRWLNTEALDTLFTEEERARLQVQTSAASVNDTYGCAYPDGTEDMLTILSAEEAEEYRKILSGFGNECWVRTPGHDLSCAMYMSAGHILRSYGIDVTEEEMLARPVIRVDFADLYPPRD